jgi:hypothetical protein
MTNHQVGGLFARGKAIVDGADVGAAPGWARAFDAALRLFSASPPVLPGV